MTERFIREVEERLSHIGANVTAILALCQKLVKENAETVQKLDNLTSVVELQQSEIEQIQATVDIIRKDLEDEKGQAVAFKIALVDEENMGKLKAGIDFVMKDDGSAVATLIPVDAVDNPTVMPDGAGVPSWLSSDPTVVVVTPAADGMTAALNPATPPKLGTGVTISAVSNLPDGSTLSGTSDPIDVVADKAVGFKITEQ